VIVTTVSPGQSGEAADFLRSVKSYAASTGDPLTVIIYDMGLSHWETELVQTHCRLPNVSSADSYFGLRCQMWEFPHDERIKYPNHVRSSSAYRPLMIQEVLRDAGAVLYMSVSQQMVAGANLSQSLDFAKSRGGVAAWTRSSQLLPTTSMTHPNMFDMFLRRPKAAEGGGPDSSSSDVDIADYQFQHMVGLDALIVYNTDEVRRGLMLPWVKCALTPRCVNPIGAQDTGCRFDKKPQYRYSGCHAYDVSALNIVLGQYFQFDESRYICGGHGGGGGKSDRFFESVPQQPLYRLETS